MDRPRRDAPRRLIGLRRVRMALAPAAVVCALGSAGAQQRSPQVDAFVRMEALNAQLLASRSATATLETWCRDHHLADDPRIVAHQVAGRDKRPTPEQRRRLDVADGGEVKFRRVELQCGARVLSVADNWYVPGRLTYGMNRLLETTDTPFGKAVAALEPTRDTFEVRVLWSDSATPIPEALFEHRAVLSTRDHRPFSEVDEIYQRALVAADLR